jgi:hypothetical protein
MEQSATPSRLVISKICDGWVPIGTFFNATAAAKLVQMGWEWGAAEKEIVESQACQETLVPIIEKMRGCRVYGNEVPTKKPHRSGVLSEVQKAMGAAHFEVMELIHHNEIRVRATVSRTDRHSGSTKVEHHASTKILTTTAPTRRKDHEGVGLIPDYSANHAGTHNVGDAVIAISDIEVYVPHEVWKERYPLEWPHPEAASITIRYDDIPAVELRFGPYSAEIDLNLSVAALVCVILRGPERWTRWDDLFGLASQIERRPQSKDYILSGVGIQKKNDEYRSDKERVYRGLVAELGNFAAEWPWLYGHLGSLNKERPGTMEVDPGGKGIRYAASVMWTYAMITAKV